VVIPDPIEEMSSVVVPADAAASAAVAGARITTEDDDDVVVAAELAEADEAVMDARAAVAGPPWPIGMEIPVVVVVVVVVSLGIEFEFEWGGRGGNEEEWGDEWVWEFERECVPLLRAVWSVEDPDASDFFLVGIPFRCSGRSSSGWTDADGTGTLAVLL